MHYPMYSIMHAERGTDNEIVLSEHFGDSVGLHANSLL